MTAEPRVPDYGLFVDILLTLERIQAPYMVIGAFAAIIYGARRTTFDSDIVVNLNNAQVDALAAAYPPPRYYADPEQIRDSIRRGIMFNMIDSSRGDKADLVPLTMEPRYLFAFQHRIRQIVELPEAEPFEIWCARPEDVIIGKLMAWAEGRSRKHESDIHQMLLFDALQRAPRSLDIAYVDQQAQQLGEDVHLFLACDSGSRKCGKAWFEALTAAESEIPKTALPMCLAFAALCAYNQGKQPNPTAALPCAASSKFLATHPPPSVFFCSSCGQSAARDRRSSAASSRL